MKIKNMLNLSEATVILDTVDLQSTLLQNFLKKNSIKAKVVNKSGPGAGYPEVEYSGDKKALDELIHKFFGDDDLKDLIEEGIGSWMQDSGWVKGGKKRDGRGVVTHMSDVAQRKTGQNNNSEKLLRTYEKEDKDIVATMRQASNNKIAVYIFVQGKPVGDVEFFNNKNEATKWLEGRNFILRDLHEGKAVRK